ncbi:GPI inositol deacylase [Xylographa pallens]|nr:GPI inositol deacylase [Xylographa pallens]
MRRRSSGSTEDDSTDEAVSAELAPLDDDERDRSFTTSKFDVTRHSDTLDRRKVEKALSTIPLTQHAWSTEPDTYGDVRNLEYALNPKSQSTLEGKMPEQKDWRRSRIRSPWRGSVLTTAVTALSVLFFYCMVRSVLTRQRDPKGCNMSYMSPMFAKLSDFDTEHTRFASKYSLYLYREEGIDEDTMVKGVPVLFITGNAGSHKQVRPLASEAAVYFHNHIQQDPEALKAGIRGLDFFTADFNEDITAFHGQTLLDQAEYLNEAVAYILSLYHNPRRSRRGPGLPDPSSVILIGHSMGGIVARTMLIMPNYQSNSINTIITMSTPHARPPVSFDADIVRTYQRINNYWREAYSQRWANNNPLWHVTLISIAGGGLDEIVPSDYTSLSSLVPETHGFTVYTSSIPNVWTGADHLSILWCDQLRKPIIRSLIEAIDVRRPGQTKPRADRMKIFKRWYLTGMEEGAEKTLPQKEPTTLLTLEDNSNSILSAGERLTVRDFGHSGKPKAYLLPIPPQGTPGGTKFTLLSDQPLDIPGGAGKLEVLFCSVFPLQAGHASTLFSMSMDLSGTTSGSTRLACKNAASDVIPLPASTRASRNAFEASPPFSFLQYQVEQLAEHQFVAVIDKTNTPDSGWAIAEFSDDQDSVISTNVALRRLLMMGLRVRLSADRPTVSEIKIPALYSSLLAYKLTVGAQACGDEAELFTPLLRQYLLDPHESKYFVNVKEANVNFHGVAPFLPPPLQARSSASGISLQLWSDPNCNSSIDITLEVDVLGSLGKLYMRYRTVVVAFPLLIVALVLRKQFMIHDATGVFITFAEALDLSLRRSLPMLLAALSLIAISLASVSDHAKPAIAGPLSWATYTNTTAMDFTKNDALLGSQDPFFWFLIPLFGIVSVGVCVLVNYAALTIIHVLYIFYSFLTAKPAWIRTDDRRQRTTAAAFAAVSPRRRIITTGILLFMVSTIIPYQFAYMVACIVQIATCTRALRLAKDTRSGLHCNFYNYAHSILILMLWILPINIPVLVVWVHNLAVHWLTPFSSHHNVLSIMPFIVLVETLTGGTMIPRITTSFRHVTNILFFFLAMYAAIYGVTFAYQLHHLVNIACAWLVAVHFSASNLSLSGLTHMLEGDDEEGDVKKRP